MAEVCRPLARCRHFSIQNPANFPLLPTLPRLLQWEWGVRNGDRGDPWVKLELWAQTGHRGRGSNDDQSTAGPKASRDGYKRNQQAPPPPSPRPKQKRGQNAGRGPSEMSPSCASGRLRHSASEEGVGHIVVAEPLSFYAEWQGSDWPPRGGKTHRGVLGPAREISEKLPQALAAGDTVEGVDFHLPRLVKPSSDLSGQC